MPFSRDSRLTVAGWLAVVAAIALTFGGLVLFARATRGTDHWIMSVASRPGGMTILVGKVSGMLPEAINHPTYMVDVMGQGLGRDIKPFAIDETDRPFQDLPIQLLFADTSDLPGYCRLQVGPVRLDIADPELSANGIRCEAGGRIEIRVTPLPP